MGVFDPGFVGCGLFWGEEFGDGFAVVFAGPLEVGAVEFVGVVGASAGGFAAAHVALGDAAGEREADLAELTGESLLGSLVSGAGFGHGHSFHRGTIHHHESFSI